MSPVPRVFDRSEPGQSASSAPHPQAGLSAARTIAAAVSVLLVSLLVVTRSVTAFGSDAASVGNLFGFAGMTAAEQRAPGQSGTPGAAAEPPQRSRESGGASGTSETDAGPTAVAPTPPAGSSPSSNADPPATPDTAATNPPQPPPTQNLELSDDDSGAALFNLPSMAPQTPYEACIAVSYTGSLPATVSLHSTAAGDLASRLQIVVDAGGTGAFADCADFVAEATLFDGTLADFSARHGPGTEGLPGFEPQFSPAVRTFRFTFLLDPTLPGTGGDATADFTWTTAR